MPPVPATFRDALVELDGETFATFVEAVYDARGWETECVGDDVVVSAPGDPDRRRLVVRDAESDADLDAGDGADTAADRVVVPTLVPDAESGAVVDAADLLEMVLYAVDDADRTRLFERFFDGDPTAVDADASDGSTADRGSRADIRPTTGSASPTSPGATATLAPTDDDGDGDGDGARPSTRRLALGVSILVALVGVALVLGPGVGVGPALSPVADTGGESGVADANATGTNANAGGSGDADASASGARTTSLEPTAPRTHPPGVDADGIANASALADAHEATLDGRSYRLSVVAREFVAGRPTAVARERTVVESPTRYRSDVRVVGTFRQEPRVVADASTYANGTQRFVRLSNATDINGRIGFDDESTGFEAAGRGWRSDDIESDADPFANRTATYLRRTLYVENSTIIGTFERNETTHFWIRLRRPEVPDTDATGSIVVDQDGLIREIRYERAYISIDSPSIRTVITLRITPENVTATPPSWR